MRIVVISAAFALATAATAQEKNPSWQWDTSGVPARASDAADPAPASVLDRLEQSKSRTPDANEQRRREWLDRFAGSGTDGGEGGGGDAGGASSH